MPQTTYRLDTIAVCNHCNQMVYGCYDCNRSFTLSDKAIYCGTMGDEAYHCHVEDCYGD